MAIILRKGEKIDLTKTNPGLKKITVGLGWDVNRYDGGGDFDLDASAFLCNVDGKVSNQNNFIFYGHLSTDGVKHMGDNLTGDGEGDDEQISINLGDVNKDVEKIAFTVTIYEADERKQNFGMVENAYIRVVNADTGEELIRYDLSEDYSSETAIVVSELYRHSGEWKFNAIGSGFSGGLKALGINYGLNIA